MKYDGSVPIYLQIIEKIKNDIINGTLKQGEKLPSIQEMAIKMSVNQNTISRVYKECETLGIIETRRGVGSFVIDSKSEILAIREEKIRLITQNFIRDLETLGYSKSKIFELVKKVCDESTNNQN